MEEVFGLKTKHSKLCLKVLVFLACLVPWVNQVIAEVGNVFWNTRAAQGDLKSWQILQSKEGANVYRE